MVLSATDLLEDRTLRRATLLQEPSNVSVQRLIPEDLLDQTSWGIIWPL